MERGKVLVTGVSGFIAKHIVLQLLQAGYDVRGSVRSPERDGNLKALLRPHLADPSSIDRRLTLAILDLERDDGWKEALAGASALIHTASPFPAMMPRNPEDLSRPAVEGTLRALRAARDAGVRRVVVTSSIVAIMNRRLPAGRTTYNEDDWSDPDGPLCSAYGRSKTLAEHAAWDFVKREAPEIRLTTINPGFVFGPPLDDHYGTSVGVVARMLSGKDPAVPNVAFPVVDVRDVARMHVLALQTPTSEHLRFAATEALMAFRDMAKALKQAYPSRKIATRRAPDFLMRFLSIFDKSIALILPELGRRPDVSNARAKEVFGIDFIPAREALLASARELIQRKLV